MLDTILGSLLFNGATTVVSTLSEAACSKDSSRWNADAKPESKPTPEAAPRMALSVGRFRVELF